MPVGSSPDPVLALGTDGPNGVVLPEVHMVAPRTPGHLEHPEHPHTEHPEQHKAEAVACIAANSDSATVDEGVDSTIDLAFF